LKNRDVLITSPSGANTTIKTDDKGEIEMFIEFEGTYNITLLGDSQT